MIIPPAPRMSLRLALLAGLALIACSAPMAACQAQTAGGAPFTADDLLRVKTITETQVAPDGREILYVVSQADLKANKYRGEIWSISANGSGAQRLTSGEGDESSPHWSPDGSQIAFLSAEGGAPQIYVSDEAGRDVRKVTEVKSGVQAFQWSPDGKRIAFSAVDETPGDEQPVVRIVDAAYDLPQLFILDLASRQSRRVTDGTYMVEDFSWAPDNDQIAFTRRRTPLETDDFQTDIYVLSLASGAARPIAVHPGRHATPKWSHDGAWIAFMATPGGVGEDASAHILVVPAAGGAQRNVSASLGERIYDFYGWSPDDRKLYFRVRAGVTMQVIESDVQSGRTSQLTSGDRVYDSVSFSEGAHPVMTFVATDSVTPKDLYISSASQFRPQRILVSNPDFAQFRMPRQQIVHWKGKDGLPIEGLLTLPVGYQPGVRYPLLVAVHGGPSAAFSNGFAPQFGSDPAPLPMEVYPPQLFAEAGYAMFMPNIRGSGGYGEAFRVANHGDWGGADLQDILTGVDALIDQGVADKDRLGVLGWSYGGFMAAFIITQTDRFKAASVGAGVTDIFSMYGTSVQPDQIEAYFKGRPSKQESLYRGRSAVFLADRIKTPTLIQEGDLDPDVPPEQADELYRALKDRNIPVEYARYPRSGHAPTEPKQNRDVWTRNIAWFDRWLKPRKD